MKWFFSHLGTILIVGLLGVAATVTLGNPEMAHKAFQEAWAGLSGSPVEGSGSANAGLSIVDMVQRSDLLCENSPAEWVVVLACILLGFLAGKIASAVASRVGHTLERSGRTVRAHVIGSLAGPASLVLFTFSLSLGVAVLKVDPPLGVFLRQVLATLYVVSVVWYVYNLIELIDVGFERLRGRIESRLDAQLVPLIRKTLRVVLVVLAALYVAKNVYDQNVSTWLAGLGIAGLAVSLAAQDSLKNLFGSLTILLDRTFKVGERIICSGYDGVIEDIGFRATKVRTVDGHLVTIPNANIVNSPIENIDRRPYIRRVLNVTVTYDTTRDKIGDALAIIKRIMAEDGIREPIHPSVRGKDFPPRVFFNAYNADSLNLTVIYWYAPPNYWDYMEHAERVNFRIFEEFEKAGIEFAFPTQTLYLAGDPRRKLAVEMHGGDR